MDAAPTSYAAFPQIAPLGAPASMRVRVKVSDPTRAIQLRDYFRRLGLFCALANDIGTVEAECPPGSDLQRITREELDGYLDGWAKTNRVPVQLQ
jgi:hypothetical protein